MEIIMDELYGSVWHDEDRKFWSFLTLVYVVEGSEDQIRSSVRLVASVFKRWISLRIELREVSFEGLLNISGKRL